MQALLEVLDDLSPETPAVPPPAAPGPSSLERSLQRILEQIQSMERSQASLADSVKASRVGLETTAKQLQQNQQQIEEIQERLDAIEGR